MPSPLTHIMLVKNECDEIEDIFKNKDHAFELAPKLARYSAELCTGSISPDITYFTEQAATRILANFFQDDIHFIADCIHLENSNLLFEAGINHLKRQKDNTDPSVFDAQFAFLCGYMAHVVADGVIHPYVRDKVGDYVTDEAKFNHRLLEMRLDILLCHHFYGHNLNNIEFQDELDGLKHSNELFCFISDITNTAYPQSIQKTIGRKLTAKDMENSYVSAKQAFEVSSHRENIPLPWLNHLMEKKAVKHEDFSDDKINTPAIRELSTPKTFNGKTLDSNFMGKPTVDFVNDVVPRFAQVYLPLLETLYGHIYHNESLALSMLPPFSLDDGRLLSNLEGNAFYWE